MSHRRKPRRQPAARSHHTRSRDQQYSYDQMAPWIWAMQDADAAERLGDATGALAAMDRRATGPDGEPFWRPSRRRRLEQVVAFGDDLPGWARSRWVLEQALQHLTDGDRRHGVHRQALDAALRVHGGIARVRARTRQERELDLMDFDWFYRQVFLYDAGGLERFLRDVATPDLVAGADRIAEWVHAPMRGFTFVGRVDDGLLWYAAGTTDVVETPNLATAVALDPGDCVVARLVPTTAGMMFDGLPLAVPETLARAVEADPPAWLSVCRRHTDLVQDGTIDPRHAAWRGLLSDLPIDVIDVVLDQCPVAHPSAPVGTPAARARAALELAAQHRLREVLVTVLTQHGDEHALDELEAAADTDDMALVHAALGVPEITAALVDEVTPDDQHVLEHARDHLAEPARTVVVSLLERIRSAAA